MGTNENVFHDAGLADEALRRQAIGQRGAVLWLTGLSGSGKSTLARAAEQQLLQEGLAAFRLDGDNMRGGLCADLGFSAADRDENIRRLAETAALMQQAGLVVLVSAISPFEKMRAFARSRCSNFALVYVKASVAACAARDVKGLYARAARGEIADFTGVSSPYEIPENPELTLDTEREDEAACLRQLLALARALSR